MRQPNFDYFLTALRREVPARPVLFELFLNHNLYRYFCQDDWHSDSDPLGGFKTLIKSYQRAGHDGVTVMAADTWFRSGEKHRNKSVSQNEGAVIADRASFEAYEWPDFENTDYSRLEKLAPELPDGMKFIVFGPGGVLENAINLVGYEAICLMSLEDPDLTQEIFDSIGSRLVTYYKNCSPFDSVGAVMGNDDWGFRTQTVFPPADMRKYVFPWHKKIVEAIHAAGKPAILHSCGQLVNVMDDVIDDIGYDAKHSYEDKIQPVEEAYEMYHDRIAVIGGIDVDFLCRSTPEEIKKRSRAMLERTADRGGYILGSGNSIPDYVPNESYLAMISVVNEI